MGVPDTTTFTLQDVADEFSLGTNDGLIDCFEEATSADFDPNYSGDKDNLLNFRNYDGTASLPSFVGSLASSSAGVSPCNPPLTMNITYYHNGSGTYPVVGDTVYTNSSGSTPYGSINMRAALPPNGGTALEMKAQDGIITTKQDCGPP